MIAQYLEDVEGFSFSWLDYHSSRSFDSDVTYRWLPPIKDKMNFGIGPIKNKIKSKTESI